MPKLTNPCWIFFDYRDHINRLSASMMERIGEYERVVVVNLPISVLRGGQIPSLKARCSWRSADKRCCHYRPLHFPERLPGLRRISQWLNFSILQRELREMLPPDFQRIIIYDRPSHHRIVGRLQEVLKIYYPLDDLKVTLTGNPLPGELEAECSLLAKVDLVLCASQHLANQLRSHTSSPTHPPIHIFSNPYNERLFVSGRNWQEPEALHRLPRPRLLVAGHISDRIDWEGIREASQRRPHWTWVFKGSTDPGMPDKIDQILGSKGFYHPPTAWEEVPSWIAHCDAGAVPYCLNPFTQASNPVKAVEYLAMGIPVLSTKTSSLECYGEVIEWVEEGNGKSYAQALDAVEKQLRDEQKKMLRQQAVVGDSLGERVQQLREIVFSSGYELPPEIPCEIK